MDMEMVRIGPQTLGKRVGKHMPQKCIILQKLEAKEKDWARTKEEAKEKETKEKGKDFKAVATFVANGDIQQRIVLKEKEKEKEKKEKEDSKEREKDSKETAGLVGQEATRQQIAQKAKEKEKEEKDCIQFQSQAKSLEQTGEPQRDTIAGMKKQNWLKQSEQLIA